MRGSDVIAVAAEILCRGLPVGVKQPPVRPAHFRAALATVKKNIEIPRHVAQVLAQRWRFGIERREDQSLIAVDLRNGNQTPLLALESLERVDHRHEREFTVARVRPAVVGAGKKLRITAVGAADPIAAMAA